jgi:hypothetical protein
MKRKKPFSLYRRGDIWYVRLWDEATGTYTGGKSTGETDRDKAAVKAADMIKAGQIVKKKKTRSLSMHSSHTGKKKPTPRQNIKTKPYAKSTSMFSPLLTFRKYGCLK